MISFSVFPYSFYVVGLWTAWLGLISCFAHDPSVSSCHLVIRAVGYCEYIAHLLFAREMCLWVCLIAPAVHLYSFEASCLVCL